MNMKRRFWSGLEFWRLASANWLWTQSYLLGRFVSKGEFPSIGFRNHAASLANPAPFLSRDPFDPLRGNGAVTAFLPQAGSSSPLTEIASYAPAQCRLPCRRPHRGASVGRHGWPATDLQDRDSAVQRYLPIPVGPLAVPRPVHLAPIPQTDEYPVRASARHLARSIARSTLSSAQTADCPHLRSRFGGADRLRPTAICSRRVPPQETRPTFLPPADLLRGSLARVRAGLSAARQYRDSHRLGGLGPTRLGQRALLHRLVAGPRPGRFRMLRQAARGIPRGTRLSLHGGGQGVRAYQEKRPPLPIP